MKITSKLLGAGLAILALVGLAAASMPTHAEDLVHHVGPVSANEPILTTVGNKRVIAFYETDGGRCSMHIVMWDSADVSGKSAARFRVILAPHEVVRIDTAGNEPLDLQCGESAETMAIA